MAVVIPVIVTVASDCNWKMKCSTMKIFDLSIKGRELAMELPGLLWNFPFSVKAPESVFVGLEVVILLPEGLLDG